MSNTITSAPGAVDEEFGDVKVAMKKARFTSRSRFYEWAKFAKRRGFGLKVPGRKGLYHLPSIAAAMAPECPATWPATRPTRNRRAV